MSIVDAIALLREHTTLSEVLRCLEAEETDLLSRGPCEVVSLSLERAKKQGAGYSGGLNEPSR